MSSILACMLELHRSLLAMSHRQQQALRQKYSAVKYVSRRAHPFLSGGYSSGCSVCHRFRHRPKKRCELCKTCTRARMQPLPQREQSVSLPSCAATVYCYNVHSIEFYHHLTLVMWLWCLLFMYVYAAALKINIHLFTQPKRSFINKSLTR